MAITIDDFNKIWASTSPLTPYTFSESNYKEGWNFVGSTPPSRQMWDGWLKMTDEKCQYLYNHEDVPVGHEYFTFNPHIPQGSLPLFGGEYSRETYSALWNWVQEQTGYLKTEAEWQTLATANNGNVPYYSDGDGSTTFRVPALNCWMRSANGTVSEVGSYLQAGLPNITSVSPTDGNGINGWTAGALAQQRGAISTVGSGYKPTSGSHGNFISLTFDASHSNSIYGNSSTVQPASVVGMWLVKAYGTVADTGVINEQQYIDDRLGTKLSLTGGTMLAPIGFNALGQIGFRGTTHTTPYDICKQMIVTAGTVDSAWNDGNAKLCLHTYDDTGTNTAEDGGFALQTSDGTNAPYLEGKPNGSLKWNNNNVLTDGTTGNIISKTGTGSATNTYVTLAEINHHDAGVWLMIGHIDCSTSFNNIYNNLLVYPNSPSNPARNSGQGGGGCYSVAVSHLDKDAVVSLQGFVPSGVSTTMRGRLTIVRLA